MLDQVKFQDFSHAINQGWVISDSEGNGIDVILIKAAELTQYHMPILSQRVPFSLIFRGPFQPDAPQGLYLLENKFVGALKSVLVVPLQHHFDREHPQARYYQVTFA